MPNKNTKQTDIKILVLDDDLFVAELLAGRLRREGFQTVVTTTIDDALEKVERELPAAIILDLSFGNDSASFGFLNQIRTKDRTMHIPVIALSNTGSSEEMDRAIKAGADLYLVKAYVDTHEIIFRVKSVLQKHNLELPYFNNKFVFNTPDELRTRIDADLANAENSDNVAELADDLITYAYLVKASDIHIEPEEGGTEIRLRIDGVMHDAFKMTPSVHSNFLARIKTLAGLRVGESDINQEGHFKASVENPPRQFEVRLSTLTTYYGENAVLRILAKESVVSSIADLLLSKEDLVKINEAIEKPFGMILITGPTGSGKSTTLYVLIRKLNTREISIVSIEDPVEYTVEGIQQIQVNPRIGLTFAAGLRTILRQDPDVIMVGEIRDKETAGIAVNAALTGHLLLSTIHTSDAATTLPRLLDMGIEPFLVASTVSLAISQRLVRRICKECKVKKEITADEFTALKEKLPLKVVTGHKTFYYGKGCKSCGDTGYKGRFGVYEAIEMSDPIREAIMRRVNSEEIKSIAVNNGMTTLLEDGFRKAVAGLTTIEEILRVIHE